MDRHVDAFLEMLAAERGAARNTLLAYAADLADFAGFAAARGEAPHAAGEALLRDWLEPLSLRLRLVPPEPEEPGEADASHGQLGPGLRLELANPRLAERLQALEGFRRWQSSGGELLLREEP